MKRNFLLMVAVSVAITTASFAQVSTTPETPRNYKPEPKELAPMPEELTDEMIFPVLGKYEYTDEAGSTMPVTITRDGQNKGVVWVNGMPQGKFKADLKLSPATYKIPVQQTLQNDLGDALDSTNDVLDATDGTVATEARFSGKSLKEGTLLFDSTSNRLYINVGGSFNEENPTEIFPQLAVRDSAVYDAAATAPVTDLATTEAVKKADKKKQDKDPKGLNYVLIKVVEMAGAPTPNFE